MYFMNERKGFLLFLIAIFSSITILMLAPFFAYILGAAILAFILKKPHQGISNKIGERPSAALLTISTILLAIVPVIIGGIAIAQDSSQIIESINQTNIDFEGVEDTIYRFTEREIDIQTSLTQALKDFSTATLGQFSRLVNVLANLGVGLSIMMFMMYYFLKDGKKLIRWVKDISPLPEEIEVRLLNEISNTTYAVIKGHLFVSIAQALIAGLGLWFFGVSNPGFWTFIMMLIGLLPIIGSMLVWLPAAGFLALTDPVSGILLAIYGFVVVGMSDNFLRPFFVDRNVDLNPAVIILGVIGGVILMGIPGLFIGPVIFGITKSVLTVFMENYEDL